ncbi:MAG: peptidylprolyl isomerase [Bacteroides sp.]|nr:peptidylprolyl isomerase [Bacteroides sp.]
MKKIKSLAFAVSAAVLLTLAAGCSKESKYMGNTAEAVLEETDVFAVIKVKDYEEEITVKLYPQVAPKAVTKFIKLAEKGYYENRTFHRVVKDQLIQGGSLTGTGFDGDVSDEEYFDIETHQYMNHYYGAVCMAKNTKGNYCQFYIVNNSEPVDIDGIAAELKADLDNEEIMSGLLESDKSYYKDYYTKLNTVPAEVKERYLQVGGIYSYDGEDTVFGQVIDGWSTLKAINEVETAYGNNSDDNNGIASKPITDIIIESVEIIRITPVETTTEETTRATRATRATTESTAEEAVVNGVEITESVPETVSASDADVPESGGEDANGAEETSEEGETAIQTLVPMS